MEYRKLGRTDLSVSVIRLGCEDFIGMTEEETTQLME